MTTKQGNIGELEHVNNGIADYTVLFDGGCNGNPGPMYGSYRISTKDGRARIERCKFGYGTNNQAEYLALITAVSDILARCQQAGVPLERYTISIYGDSQLVVNQVNGKWSVSNGELQQLHRRAVDALARFKEYHLTWQSRNEIVRALGH